MFHILKFILVSLFFSRFYFNHLPTRRISISLWHTNQRAQKLYFFLCLWVCTCFSRVLYFDISVTVPLVILGITLGAQGICLVSVCRMHKAYLIFFLQGFHFQAILSCYLDATYWFFNEWSPQLLGSIIEIYWFLLWMSDWSKKVPGYLFSNQEAANKMN